ncbi:type I secretion system permease/ATPase [Pseudomonas sp. MM213]|uniref:type I secretion system permease/ATPase n=1 Tax=Pseudomonas sp. MM213 TaxID=2866807 RepID=UPI001CF43F67|nr:type I secretion system permease/ATPase [Pseudomonas sp. MM213]UCP11082.1 type I secretion system permease/ATPase [Pseudomonas sp. MM213]
MGLLLDPRHDIDAALLSYRRVFWSLALFSGVINLLVLVPSLYMMQVYDRVLTSRNETTLFMLTLIALGLFMFSALIEWARGEVMIRMSAGLDEALGERIFDAAFARSLREHNANPAQVLTDLATLRQLITGQGLIALLDAPWLPIFVLVAFIFHPWFGVLTLVLALVLIGLALWGELATRTRLDEANRLGVQSSIYVNSTLQNAEVIRALGMLGPLRQRWSLLQQRIIAAQSHASDRGARITATTRFVRISGQSLALGLGALLVLEGQLSAGMMIAMSLLLGRALAPVEIAIGSWKQFNSGRQSYQRLSQLLAQQPRERLRMPLPPPTGALRLDQVYVGPPGASQPILRGINFSLTKGDVLAVVGPSASGKSTLAKALIGVWPAMGGSVRLDDAEISQWSHDALGPHLGYLPQDIELFDGSVADNIARFGEQDANKIIAAGCHAGIHEMILKFPKGYDTPLGPGGLGLSGGQKQRLGLARALYGHPSLIVLDEPNSNLDEAGEVALVQAINALKATGSTVVLITHRPNVLAVVDHILVLKDGTQHAFGPRDRLLKALRPGPRPAAVREAGGDA